MIAYDVLITRKVPGLQYDIGVIGQCQIYLKSVLWLIMQTPLSFFDQGYSYLVQQLPKNGVLVASNVSNHQYSLGVKGQSQFYSKYVKQLKT